MLIRAISYGQKRTSGKRATHVVRSLLKDAAGVLPVLCAIETVVTALK